MTDWQARAEAADALRELRGKQTGPNSRNTTDFDSALQRCAEAIYMLWSVWLGKIAKAEVPDIPADTLHIEIVVLLHQHLGAFLPKPVSVEGVCGEKFTGAVGRTIFTCVLPKDHVGEHDDAPMRGA